MIMQRLAIGLLPLILLGCGGLRPVGAPLDGSPATPQQLVREAESASTAGRWSEAIAMLRAAARRFPENEPVQRALGSLEQAWQRERRTLEDQILVQDTGNLLARIALLDRLIAGQPDDLVLLSRKLFWKETLQGKLDDLTRCGNYHLQQNPWLAGRCLRLAADLDPHADLSMQFAAVDEQLAINRKDAAKRERADRARQRHGKAKRLLTRATAEIDSGNYREALNTLDELDALQPNNTRAVDLRARAWSMISPQVDALVKLGDHLYLEEQVEAAIATWQAALRLSPQDASIASRIERAETVLKKLDTLREKQGIGPTAPNS